MKAGLVGYTGFVGSNLMNRVHFSNLYNSKNAEEMKGEHFDLLICAGAPAVKWKANQEPDQDWGNIQCLISNLKEVKANKLILISTVDVYQQPRNVTEKTFIDPEHTDPYGKHRFFLEEFCSQHFKDTLIVRLPGLFGKGLKKNFIYDLIYDNCLHLTHKDSRFQFYDLSRLWDDLQTAMANGLNTVNFSSQPISAQEVAAECFKTQFTNVTSKEPVAYDMKSEYAACFGGGDGYLYSKNQIIDQLKAFIEDEKRGAL
ncbi:pyridine nucleotide transhydrogenase [Paenibacillus sp.]|uniref:pyridine nucleotide transhydrogenase n=1 Tax=Paenibacillus sp. TaxID=58172 RepID=UPI002810F2C3|nr:pyridine nucleotide transhydrogenase [Paenibacillus sp.]